MNLVYLDLWIGHDQLELKGIEEDETLNTTLARSASPDYRSASSMDRTRGYPLHPYSGKTMALSYSATQIHTLFYKLIFYCSFCFVA